MKTILTPTAFALALTGGCSSNDKYPVFTFIPAAEAQVMSDEMGQRERRSNLSASWSGRHDISKSSGVYTYREGHHQVILDRGNLVVKGAIPRRSVFRRALDWFRQRTEPSWRQRSRGQEERSAYNDRWGRSVTIDRDGQTVVSGSPPNGIDR